MSDLIRLAQLRKDLQRGVEALVEGMESQPGSANLSAFVEIADRCMRLERDVGLLTRELLEYEQPQGAA